MLAIENLTKVYPGNPPVAALTDVNLQIGEGMFGLLGPNGAGKSTLMKILSGLLEQTAGRVTMDGADLSDPARRSAHYERLGYLPQDFGFYGHLSGQKMLEFLLELKGVKALKGRRTLALELLERVNLAQASQRKVREYSGGMRQRLGIAQAIAGDPRLVIVDEPTAGLDPEERIRFYSLLSELSIGRIVLLSTHIIEDVDSLCPHFAVIRKGAVIVKTNPKSARQELTGKIYEGMVDIESLTGISREFHVIQAIVYEGSHKVRIFLENGNPPPDFVAAAPTLQDAYLLSTRLSDEKYGTVQTGGAA